MHRALLAALLGRGVSPDEPVDGVVEVSIAPRRAQQPDEEMPRRPEHQPRSRIQGACSEAPSSPFARAWHPFARAGGAQTADAVSSSLDRQQGQQLASLPPLAAAMVWARLEDKRDRRSLRLVASDVCAVFSRAVASLQLTARELQPGDIVRLGATFPDLSSLELIFGADSSSSSAAANQALGELRRARLPHLTAFACDARLRGEPLLAVARFLVHTPSLRVLRLPHQRGAAAAQDQRLLCAALEALPRLVELDLGSAGSSAASASAISASLLRRITRLPELQRLSANLAGVPDEELASLARLRGLRQLSLCAAGSGDGLAAALRRLPRLTHLELAHPTISVELVGSLGRARQLRVLALGLCPLLSPDTLPADVAQLLALETLALPFPLGPDQLRCLARLPALSELLCYGALELDALGLAHEPLASVSRVVAGSLNGHGQALCLAFPRVRDVVLRSCGDMEALSLAPCRGLTTLQAGDCSALSDEGFASLRTLRCLRRLLLDSASQLTDASFAAVFSGTMPALAHVSLAGCSGVTDAALQALTASCRRLASASLAGCGGLTDKTLKRLAHCEHLTSVSLRSCAGLTAEGVRALAAAPQLRSLAVSGCPGVRRSKCAASARPSLKLRLEGSSTSRTHGLAAA